MRLFQSLSGFNIFNGCDKYEYVCVCVCMCVCVCVCVCVIFVKNVPSYKKIDVIKGMLEGRSFIIEYRVVKTKTRLGLIPKQVLQFWFKQLGRCT